MKKKHRVFVGLASLIFVTWLGVLIVYDSLEVRVQTKPHRNHPKPQVNETNIKEFLQRNPKIVAAILGELQRQQQQQPQPPPPQPQVVKEETLDNKVNGAPAVLKPPANPEGPGEMGKGVHIKVEELTAEQKKKYDEGWKTYQFNVYASDMISIHRTLPDIRDNHCKNPNRYLSRLPATSVIICFYNEAWSVLLRTIHSVIERSPDYLIKEIILIDDASSLGHLKQDLDEYMSHIDKVRVIHNKNREGLIRARIIGAEASTATVLTYLDSHTEVTAGWLEPLLDAVARNSKVAAIPTIDSLNDSTFQYSWSKCEALQVGGFDWSLTYTWHAVPKSDRGDHPCDNIRSPTMAGGLFTIRKDFFKEIGYYDSKMDVWGGENLEISFKIWMCGGRLEAVPCSHIGHVFRRNSPYAKEAVVSFGNFVRKNTVRVARVWLDDFAHYYYQRTGTKPEEAGDVSDQLNLRDKLQCKSFKWYLDTIYPGLFVPAKAIASGEVRNYNDGKTCLDSLGSKAHHAIGLYVCHSMGGNQYWSLTKEGEIRQDDNCLDYSGSGDVILYPCHSQEGNQYWVYHLEEKKIQHRVSRKCIGMDITKKSLVMVSCDDRSFYINWKFQNEVPDKIKELKL